MSQSTRRELLPVGESCYLTLLGSGGLKVFLKEWALIDILNMAVVKN